MAQQVTTPGGLGATGSATASGQCEGMTHTWIDLVPGADDWWQSIGVRPTPSEWCQLSELAECTRVEAVAQKAAGPRADVVLGFLLERLQSGDGLAGIVVVGSQAGVLRRLAAADRHRSWRDYLGQMWLVAVAYPLDRRPAGIAANLAWDTFKSVRARPAPERSYDPSVLDRLREAPRIEEDPIPTGDEVISRALRLGFIDEQTARVLHSVYIEGMPGRVAAVRHATTPTAIRWRCSSSLRRLAARSAELLAAS